MPEPGTQEAHAYTDGASGGSRGPGGYGAVLTWKGKTEEISGGEQDTTNLRMEVTAACVALETIVEGHVVTVYSDSSYLLNCMRRGWYKKWRENGWLNHLGEPVANRELWERLLEGTRRHREVRSRKVKGHSKTGGAHKSGNDRADELAVTAKKEASGTPRRPATSALLRQSAPKAHCSGSREPWETLVVWLGVCREPFPPRVTFLPLNLPIGSITASASTI